MRLIHGRSEIFKIITAFRKNTLTEIIVYFEIGITEFDALNKIKII